MIGDRDIYLALKKIRALGGIVGVHCENAGVIDGMIHFPFKCCIWNAFFVRSALYTAEMRKMLQN